MFFESFLRKVEVFNEEYRLKEKGAILNWFDINEREGYYSLNSKIEDIMKSEEGAKVFMSFMTNLGNGWANNSKEQNEEEINKKMKMLGAFKVLRYITLLSATNVKVTKEELLELNDKLNQIAQ